MRRKVTINRSRQEKYYSYKMMADTKVSAISLSNEHFAKLFVRGILPPTTIFGNR